MQFKPDQFALHFPKRYQTDAARALLAKLGITTWADDHVVAHGHVHDLARANEANLAFNYTALVNVREFELLEYTTGDNWMQVVEQEWPAPSHLGMHVTADELVQWREFFAKEGFNVAQEVITQSHTNPHLNAGGPAAGRTYNYVIFDTRSVLGIDLKFIVRREPTT